MIGETVHYSLDRLINFAEKENQLPLEETFAFRYIEDLEKRLDLITNHEIKGDWCAYWEAASDERNIAGFICDRLSDGVERTWLPFSVEEDLFANFDHRPQKGPGYTGGMYFGVPAAAFEDIPAISEYFSRFLSVPAHKELERAISKVSKYRDLIRATAKQLLVERIALRDFKYYLQRANQVLFEQKNQTKTKRTLAGQRVKLNGSIENQPLIVAQVWQPAAVDSEFFQTIFSDTGVRLTPKIFDNPVMLKQLDLSRKHYWETQAKVKPD